MDKLKVFENKQIRAVWNEEQEDWYFSVVDVVAVLTDSKDYTTGRKYWNKLKQRLSAEGSERLDEIADPEKAILRGVSNATRARL